MSRKISKTDRTLGMDRQITRRDFLNGVAVTLGATLLGSDSSASDDLRRADEYYPPSLTGLRGNHEGSYETMHALRDQLFWEKAGAPIDTREEYDLVIVGAGISGLSAAYFFQKYAGPTARILMLENHDDFGGHAKRNEFRIDGRTILGFGGTWSIDSPAPYSAVARNLITDVGIDIKQWATSYDAKLYSSLGMHPGIFFNQESFGSDKLVPFFSEYDPNPPDPNSELWKHFLQQAPLTAKAKLDLNRIYMKPADYLPHVSSAQKKRKLATISYAQFLSSLARVDSQVVKLFQARPHNLYGVGIDAVSAQDAWGLGYPGFQGMKLDPAFGKGMNLDAMLHAQSDGEYFFHFPDGNATLARLLVRKLIPKAMPGQTMVDVVTAKCTYSQLDNKSSPTRIRLNSTVVRVKTSANRKSATPVEVVYMRGKKLHSVRAKACVLACWHSVIPYICAELPQQQKQDLLYAVKVPLLYTNVLISNWKSFVKAGIHTAYCPDSYHSIVNLDWPVSVGTYKAARNPNEPIIVHMMRTPCSPGLPARSQHRAGRMELLSTNFATYERNIRQQLARMFGPYGLDVARDVRAITVNRWAHGYAYQYNSLFDPFWLEGKQTPCERARKPFGRIAIANADAAAYSYTDAAIDQAHRAVKEILELKI